MKTNIKNTLYEIFVIIVVMSVVLATITCIELSIVKRYNARRIQTTVAPMEPDYGATPCRKILMVEAFDDHSTYINTTTPVETTAIVTEDVDTHTIDKEYNVIFEWQKYSGDFGAEQLEVLQEYCNKHDVPVKLMLAIISHESGFESDSKSPDSSASGYCQIIRGTAEDIYENDLGYGEYDTYNHEYTMMSDWELNIEIGCRLMRNNYEECNSWEHAIYMYYGSSDINANIDYFWKINTRLYELFNISVCDLV